MATLSVRDSANNVVSVNSLPPVGTANSAQSLPFTPASDAVFAVLPAASELHLGKVGGESAVRTADVATASYATPYASGDVIGSKLTFTTMVRIAGGTGLVQQVSVASKSTQAAAVDLVLFHTDPTGSTFTDNSPVSLATADFDKISAVVSIANTNWSALGTPSFGQVVGVGTPYQIPTGTSMYGVLVARGAVTLATSTDLKVIVKSFLD